MKLFGRLIDIFISAAIGAVAAVYFVGAHSPFPAKTPQESFLASRLPSGIPEIANSYDRSVVSVQAKGKELSASGPKESVGTGFAVTYKGEVYILTNEHIVSNGGTVSAKSQGETLEMEVAGSDFDLDLAVLRPKNKIDEEKLVPAKLGDSSKSQVGEWALAIGFPLNIGKTVTSGIISAKDKSFSIGDRRYEDLFQTDAHINPGNSGGPLINMSGEVIGINTALMDDAQGIAFSIPIDSAKAALDSLVEKGYADHPFLGVSLTDGGSAVSVSEVVKGSPAEKAGVLQGDAVLRVGGLQVKTAKEFSSYLKSKKIGEEVSLVVKRDGKEKLFRLLVGNKKDIMK